MSFNVPSGWKAVIGLEIHAQLLTKSKMFSSDSAAFGAMDNENVSPVSLGMPGALPVINKKAVEYSIKAGLALGCQIRDNSVFARKHYFYPDLSKGYQISQYDLPICYEGSVEFLNNGEKKKVRIERAHMEEDAGKSIHDGSYSLINYNRSSVPLLEIVSGPDMTLPSEAAEYTRTIRSILQYLEVCDGNLEEGSLRCDCNVSVMKTNETKYRTRVEIKNINSFRFIEKALEYEILRQIDVYEDGGEIYQETRLYDSAKNKTFSMRGKEEAKDYRYFRDPDLLPVKLDSGWVENIKKSLPELPIQRANRFQSEMGLPEYDALVLTQDKKMADYFEKVVKLCNLPKQASNWIMGELLRNLNEEKKEFNNNPISAEHMAELILAIEDKTISGKMAKTVFLDMWKTSKSPRKIVAEQGMSQITDPAAVDKIVSSVIKANPGQVEQYKSGKTKLFGFFVGLVMKESKGQANPDLVNEILKKYLDS
jgi:aspartyl-tRNA(Asn)/glutamyl-tRNA(Gln) amidotransferase subunit B